MNRRRKYDGRYCIAYGCLNSNKKSLGLSFFSLPRDPERRRVWLTSIGREDLFKKENLRIKSYEVCEYHFDESFIRTIKHLTPDAVPTKFLPSQDGTAPQYVTNIAETNLLNNYESFSDNSSTNVVPNIDIRTFNIIDNSITNALPDIGSNTFCVNPSNNMLYNVGVRTFSVATQTILEEEEQEELTDKRPLKRKLSINHPDSSSKYRGLEWESQIIKREEEANDASVTPEPGEDIIRRLQILTEWRNKLNNYTDYKLYSFSLYISSPQAYRCLETALKLPSKSTLNTYTFIIPPKLDDRVLNSLLLKMKSLSQKAKYCTICVDKIDVKCNLWYNTKTDEVIGFHNINGHILPDIASNAYVIMLQGININWKQPIAYAFLANTKRYAELNTWINDVIRSLFSLGIEVKALVSDQNSNFDKFSREIKRITVEYPYFTVDERKIYYIFHVPQLLMSVRDNLIASDFHHEGNIISWKYIKALYEDQKNKKVKIIPKILKAHIDPTNSERIIPKYASQLFSNTVYTALETYIDFGKIPEEAKATADFVKIMNDLFDVLNSNKVNGDKHLQTSFRMTKEQKSILEIAQSMFENIISSNHKVFVNFQITIQSFMQLYEDLNKEGIPYIFTRTLNKDNLELFLKSIRQQSDSCVDPTPIQFRRIFSKLFLKNMLSSSASNHRDSDIGKILQHAEDIFGNDIAIPYHYNENSLVSLEGDVAYRIKLPETNTLTYIAGYLVFKCSKKHNCVEMLAALKTDEDLGQTNLFPDYESCNKETSFQEFRQYVANLEEVFTDNFVKCIQGRPGSRIYQLLKQIPLKLLCPCFPIDYLLKLFVRLRIYATISFNNRRFKEEKRSKKQFLKLNQI